MGIANFFKRLLHNNTDELEERIDMLEEHVASLVNELGGVPDVCDKCYGELEFCLKCYGGGLVQKRLKCDWPWE